MTDSPHRRRTRTRRRGIAPLELVMSLPILLMLFATVIGIGWASLEKSGVAIGARNQAWQRRWSSDRSQENQYLSEAGSCPLSAISVPLSGEIGAAYRTKSCEFNLPSWLGSDTVARSGNSVLMGSWDYNEVAEFDHGAPHFDVLAKMAIDSWQGVEGIVRILQLP